MTDPNIAAAMAVVAELQPALARQDRARLNDIVARLVAMRAPMGGQWQALAQLVAHNGEIRLARQAIDLFVEAQGGAPAARFQKSVLLAQMGAWNEAYAIQGALPENVPDPATNAYIRGSAALTLGRSDEARRHLERAALISPHSGAAWLALAMSTDLARAPELADRIVAAERGMQGAPPLERGAYGYALGRARAARGEPALAFAAFAGAGCLMKSAIRYDRDEDRRNAEEAVHGYDADRVAAIARQQREATARPIFVTGLPRSGTTLVEQILTSHSAVGDGGEINRINLLVRDMGGPSYSALSRFVGSHGVAAVAQLCLHWLDERFPAPGRIVDKTITASRFLGVAAAVLPEAPLIWLTRDPLDCAWSCLRTYFLEGAAWSLDLEDIAFHFRLEDQLLRQWQQILGDRLLVVPYEALVVEPEQWIRRILVHCGLREEPQVFAPHETQRPVATASVMQVRRPINREGIGSAEPYRAFLKPFIDAYYG